MPRYRVYLEIAENGLSMAHVLDLPGCFARAPSREGALAGLPRAIRSYYDWLRRHGQPAPSVEEAIEVEVAGEQRGVGPFEHGDAAALFPPERAPISQEEMAVYFRLMDYARADLLALVEGLPDEVLDWAPGPEAVTVRRLLRHVGNAEQWYVSRLVPPETLPAPWDEDEDMPLFEFLEMERRTAVARLRRLDASERGHVVHPTLWTDYPEEAWTLRKVLRRFLEHEREHTAQIAEILEQQRRHVLARLIAARAELLAQLLGLEREALTETPLSEDWTVQDLLVHIAAWDRWGMDQMQRVLGGERPDLATARDEDAFNAANVAAWEDRSLEEVIAELRRAWIDWLAWMEALPVAEFLRARPFSGEDWSFPGWLSVYWRHDAGHAAQVVAWREAEGLRVGDQGGPAGPKGLLLLALEVGRQELRSALGLVPAGERATRPVCGVWTAQDVAGHIIDWEQIGVEALRHMAAGRDPDVDVVVDLDAWNQAHVEARRGQSWERLGAELRSTREALMEVLESVDEKMLSRSSEAPWGGPITPYDLVCIYIEHDREHARDIRQAFSASAGRDV